MSWRELASCKGMDHKLWFAGNNGLHGPRRGAEDQTRQALKICDGCPVKAECLEDSINLEFGIFGGVTAKERHRLRKGSGRRKRRYTFKAK